MVKQAPSPGRILAMVVFALSCFGLMLYLWLSFGGALPLKPQGYRFSVDMPEAVSLSEQADVRISGVTVGRIVRLGRDGDRARATIELDSEYAPLPSDSRAILRVKTLLGETYIALTPGNRDATPVPDGGALADANVTREVELDEVLRSFDRPTRRALQAWMGDMATAVEGRSQDINDIVGNLGPAAENGAGVLEILDAQRRALRRLTADSGTVFGAIGERAGAVQELVRSGRRLFAETARREDALSETVVELPRLLAQTRATLRTGRAAAGEAGPVVDGLSPAAHLLTPALRDTAALAPDARRLFAGLGPVIDASREGLPAATKLLEEARPLVGALLPFAQDLVPVVRYLGEQRLQVAAGIANVATDVNASFPGPTGDPIHYLRAITYFSQEGFVGYPERLPSNRRNPYLKSGGLTDVRPGSAIKTYDCENLGNPDTAPEPEPPPPCIVQEPYPKRWGGGMFPRLTRDTP